MRRWSWKRIVVGGLIIAAGLICLGVVAWDYLRDPSKFPQLQYVGLLAIAGILILILGAVAFISTSES